MHNKNREQDQTLTSTPTLQSYQRIGERRDTGEVISELVDRESELILGGMVFSELTIRNLRELALNLTIQRGLSRYQIDSMASLKEDAYKVGQIELINRLLANSRVTS